MSWEDFARETTRQFSMKSRLGDEVRRCQLTSGRLATLKIRRNYCEISSEFFNF